MPSSGVFHAALVSGLTIFPYRRIGFVHLSAFSESMVNFRVLILVGFVLFGLRLSAQEVRSLPDIRMDRLSLKHGLSQATIQDIHQDRLGFIWLGTEDGLNLYDGYTFEVFRHEPTDSLSLSSNDVTSICDDIDGNLWVGTSQGLNVFQREKGTFRRYFSWFEDSTSLSSNKITSLLTDHKGRVWVGTQNGLNRYLPEEDAFEVYKLDPDNSKSLSNNVIHELYQDDQRRLWVATDGGLNMYVDSTDSFMRLRRSFGNEPTLSSNNIQAVAIDSSSKIWIGTDEGLDLYNPQTESYTHFELKGPSTGTSVLSLCYDDEGKLWIGANDGFYRWNEMLGRPERVSNLSGAARSLSSNRVSAILQDYSGLLWIGTNGSGLFKFDKNRQHMRHYSSFNQADSINYSDDTHEFKVISKDSVWIGTGAGLVSYNPQTATFRSFRSIKDHPLSRITESIQDIEGIRDSVYWFGTYGGSVYKYLVEKEKLERIPYEPTEPGGLRSDRINDLLLDGSRFLYIATSGGGVSRMDTRTNEVTTFAYEPGNDKSLQDNNVLSLARDQQGNIWFGTGNAGLYRLTVGVDTLHHITHEPGNPATLGNNTIHDIEVGQQNQLWIATKGGGLNLLNTNSFKIRRYTTRQGLANDVVYTIVIDGNSNLWLSTNKGISFFDIEERSFRNYSEDDGLVSNNYNFMAGESVDGGLILIGGTTGFDAIQWPEIKINKHVPEVHITSLNLLQPDQKGQLRSTIFNNKVAPRDTFRISYRDPGFTLEFAALDFHQPDENQFAFMMEGLIDSWTYIGGRNYTSFTNLEPGNYLFRVKASNNDGVWNNKGMSMAIVVEPAFWQTLWFKVSAVLAFLLFLWGAYKLRVAVITRQKRELENTVQERTKEIARERDTNAILLREIHHRVKNNLQIIISLLSLQSRFVNHKEVITLFDECQNRIRSMSLIHQKMYSNKDLSSVNIEEYITDLVNNLVRTYRLDEVVELDLDIDVNKFDPDTLSPLGLIINEVISNSLKYAFKERKYGKITVHLSRLDEEHYKLVIGDDGVGIPRDLDLANTETFGTELLDALTDQLSGSIRVLESEQGTIYEVVFMDVPEGEKASV